ncbi:hypothetical protein Ancab_028202 [Ancistrocladus abbreviatus]
MVAGESSPFVRDSGAPSLSLVATTFSSLSDPHPTLSATCRSGLKRGGKIVEGAVVGEGRRGKERVGQGRGGGVLQLVVQPAEKEKSTDLVILHLSSTTPVALSFEEDPGKFSVKCPLPHPNQTQTTARHGTEKGWISEQLTSLLGLKKNSPVTPVKLSHKIQNTRYLNLHVRLKQCKPLLLEPG